MTAEFNAGHNQLASCKPLGASKKFITPRENSQAPSQTKMILTNCAACAAPLAHTAPRCIRCQTRYCNKTCQHDHWRRGHKQMCKKIHRGGNAEQYHADKKYKEAVAVAVEACADDTMLRRLGAEEHSIISILIAQGNLANSYQKLGRLDEALGLRRDAYSGFAKILGKQHANTFVAGSNYAHCLLELRHLEEAKSLLCRMVPVARRVLGDSNETTLRLRWSYARALYENPGATLDDIREAVMTLEETTRIARQVLGGAHPLTVDIEYQLRDAELRAALRAREAPDDETVDGSAQEDEADDAESPTPVAAPMPAEATVAPRPPPPLPRPLPRRVTSILCCW